jgi:hypothetical protein
MLNCVVQNRYVNLHIVDFYLNPQILEVIEMSTTGDHESSTMTTQSPDTSTPRTLVNDVMQFNEIVSHVPHTDHTLLDQAASADETCVISR